MEFKKAFDYIVGKVEEELVKQNYTKQKVVAENDNELVSLFTSATLAYSVVYYKDKEQMVLRSCTMTDEGPDNEWKTLATWLYDETVGTQKDADSIANDFIEGVSGTLAIKRAKQVKERGHSAGCGLLRQHNLERTLGTSQQPAVLRGERLRRSRQVLWDGSGRRSGQQSPYEPLCAEAEPQG